MKVLYTRQVGNTKGSDIEAVSLQFSSALREAESSAFNPSKRIGLDMLLDVCFTFLFDELNKNLTGKFKCASTITI